MVPLPEPEGPSMVSTGMWSVIRHYAGRAVDRAAPCPAFDGATAQLSWRGPLESRNHLIRRQNIR